MFQSTFSHARQGYRICFLLFAVVFCWQQVNAQSQSDWMQNLDGKRKITEFSIPGTHDSGSDQGTDFAKCQDKSIQQQLEAGIRFLDIRCRHYKDSFEIHHSGEYMDKNFDDVLTSCQHFLKRHKGETIIMTVKEEHTSDGNTRDFTETFNYYWDKYPNLFSTTDSIPVLNSVRGKIVLLKRFNYPTKKDVPNKGGINIDRWKDNATGQLFKPLGGYVQDEYYWGVCDARTKSGKVDKVLSCINRAMFDKGSDLYINFLSATGNFPYCFSDFVNPQVLEYLKPLKIRKVGILVMDFPSQKLIDEIISKNSYETYKAPANFSENYIGKTVRIKPSKDEKPVCYWEVKDSGTKEGDLIQLWPTEGNQTKWRFEWGDSTKGIIRIKNVNSRKYLGAKSTIENGVKCCLMSKEKCMDFFVTQTDDTYSFWSTKKGNYIPIECEDGNLGQSTKIQFWNTTKKRIQWKIKIVD